MLALRRGLREKRAVQCASVFAAASTTESNALSPGLEKLDMYVKTPIAQAVRIAIVIAAIWISASGAVDRRVVAQQSPGDAPSLNRIPARSGTAHRFYDQGNLIPSNQRQAFEGELSRARDLGVEVVVYTRLSTEDQQASQTFADQLRSAWNIESSPGADDGLVIVLTYDYSASKSHSIVASWGENTFPIRQLSAEGFERILDDEMRPAMERGDFEVALMFGIRRIINYAEYSPPDPFPLNARQRALNQIAGIASVMLLQIGILGYVIAGVISKGRFSAQPSVRALTIYLIAMIPAAVAVGLIAIVGRNGPATLLVLGIFIWSSIAIPLVISRIVTSPNRTSVVQSTVTRERHVRVRRQSRHHAEVAGRA